MSTKYEAAGDETIWESHKSALKHMYLVENKSLSKIMEVMETTHGFVATKAQYERHVTKQWKFRKNLKKEEWKAVRHEISKRKRIGKDSEIFVDGVKLDNKKVKKETQRYSEISTSCDTVSIRSPSVPNDVEVCTPLDPGLDVISLRSLPFFDFAIHLESLGDHPGLVNVIERFTLMIPSLIPDLAGNSSAASSRDQDLSIQTLGWQEFLCTSMVRGQFLPSDIVQHSANSSSILTIFQTTMFLLSNNFGEENEGIAEKAITWIRDTGKTDFLKYWLDLKGSTFDAVAESLFRAAVSAAALEIVEIFLKAGMSPDSYPLKLDYRGWMETPLSYAIRCFDPKLAKLLLRYGANPNLIPLWRICHVVWRPFEVVKILEVLLEFHSHQHQSSLPALNRRTLYLVLVIACRVGDSDLVSKSLEAGACVNEAYIKDIHTITEASQACNLEAVEILLRRGADPDVESNGKKALEIAAAGNAAQISLRLLEYGATARYSALKDAILYGQVTLCEKLLKSARAHDYPEAGYALRAAAFTGDLATLACLLYDDIDAVHYNSDSKEMGPLQIACCHNDINAARMLIIAGGDVNAPAKYYPDSWSDFSRDLARHERITTVLSDLSSKYRTKEKYTALQAAAIFGASDIIRLLMYAGAAIQRSDYVDNLHPIFLASQVNNGTAVALLNPANRNIHEFTPAWLLPEAILEGNISKAMSLIEAGIDINTPTRGGFSALAAAITIAHGDLINLLLAKNAEINGSPRCFRSPLGEAVNRGDCVLINFLLEAGAKAADSWALLAAVDEYHVDVSKAAIIQHLLTLSGQGFRKREADYGYAALQVAVHHMSVGLVELMLNEGIDPNALVSAEDLKFAWKHNYWGKYPYLKHSWRLGRTALGMALSSNHEKLPQVVKMLLKYGADPNAKTEDDEECPSTLKQALYHHSTDIVEMLIDAGAKVNAEFVEPSLLTFAVETENVKVVRRLLDEGIDVDRGNWEPSGRTALQRAVEIRHMDLVKILVEAGADVNALPSYGGLTALQAAAINGDIDMALYLLERGADVNAPGSVNEDKGRTALEGAAEHGRIDMLQLLINARVRLEGDEGCQRERAIALAKENGHHAAARLIANQSPGGVSAST